jgi:hypothetical protein
MAAKQSNSIESNILRAIPGRFLGSGNNAEEIDGFDTSSSIHDHFNTMFDDDWVVDVEEDFEPRSYRYKITVTSPDGDEYKYILYLFKNRMEIELDEEEMEPDLPEEDMVMSHMRSIMKLVADDAAEYLRRYNASGGRRRKTRKSGKKSRKTHKRGRNHAKKTHKRRY